MERRNGKNWLFTAIVLALSALGLFLGVWPVYRLCRDAWSALRQGGALPGMGLNVLASLKLLGLVMLIVTPIAFGAALWMYVVPSKRTLNRIRHALNVLAMVPAVALGLLAHIVLAPYLGDGMASMTILMCLFVLPFLTYNFERVFSEVPPELMDAGLLLGAGRTAAACRVVLPAVTHKLIRCLVACVERILGEATALLLLLGVVPEGSVLSVELFRLSQLGRQDAALLALCLGGTLMLLRLATLERKNELPKHQRPEEMWQRD